MAERVEIGGLRYDSKQKQFVFWLYRGDDEIRLVLSDKDIESLKAGDSGEAERAVQAALRQSGS
ncbi:MAG: hypothetical protein IT210_05030 [Armatimonadetes bacterium]|nr:hypothetical protein [Armatimonadota bacterium]